MKNKLYIKEKHLNMLLDIFKKNSPRATIFAYGSRIKGNCHEGSDLDLTLYKYEGENPLFKLKQALSDSNIPFIVEVNDFNNLPDSFKQEILKNYIVIYGAV